MVNQKDELLGFDLQHQENKIDYVRNYTTIDNFEPEINTPIFECTQSEIVPLENNFFGIKFEVNFWFYYNDEKLKSNSINKLHLIGLYTFCVATKNGTLFSNPSSTEYIKTCANMLKSSITQLKKYGDAENVPKIFEIPTDEKIVSLARKLGSFTSN
ncbi:MAG: hypothetical protein JNL60_11300 [Bacteroidia bacterium]|nr:hypothetical protein [Bacteroidia bacterium]